MAEETGCMWQVETAMARQWHNTSRDVFWRHILVNQSRQRQITYFESTGRAMAEEAGCMWRVETAMTRQWHNRR